MELYVGSWVKVLCFVVARGTRPWWLHIADLCISFGFDYLHLAMHLASALDVARSFQGSTSKLGIWQCFFWGA